MAERGVCETFQDWRDKATRPLIIVTAGKQGMGKSTLVNSLFNLEEQGVKTGNPGRAVTEHVTKKTHRINGVAVSIVDTPGLQDFDISEREVLGELLKETEGKADLLFYCISLMPGSKVDEKDEKIIKLLTRYFTVEIWKHTIIVLTFANVAPIVDPHTDIRVTVDNYKQQIEKVMQKAGVTAFKFYSEECPDGTPVLTARKNPEVPQAPEGELKWDEKLFIAALKKVDPESFSALLQLKIPWQSIHWTRTTVGGLGGAVVGAQIGAEIGAEISGPIGSLCGVPVGAHIVGSLAGGAIGGAGGALASSVMFMQCRRRMASRIMLLQ